MSEEEAARGPARWAQLRFSVVGPLLASPPPAGELYSEFERLAQKPWRHPISGEMVSFAASTIERWYYAARAGQDPVGVLRRKVRSDRGQQRALHPALVAVLTEQYTQHPSWSVKLHHDNLAVVVAERSELGALPSYPTLRRYMLTHGLAKQRRAPKWGERCDTPPPGREVRSYEAEYVGGLWHLDFHHGSRKLLTPGGQWQRPQLLAILDDRSRLCCHAQWYLTPHQQETTECLIHGLIQAFLKRGLPRSILSDNGSPMIAAETREGLERLSILQATTLPRSPHQNGKQEHFWTQIEGRLLAMLEGEPHLTLALLNEATLAWVEMEYQRTVHSETKQTPLERFTEGPAVLRSSPPPGELELAFTTARDRTQRLSDGTISIAGTRFEIPSAYRTLRRVQVRYAGWNLAHVWLMDEHTGVVLQQLYPLDRGRNAEGLRRPLQPIAAAAADPQQPPGIAPLLRQLMTDYAATGLPPAYLPKEIL
jgi:putative transposase